MGTSTIETNLKNLSKQLPPHLSTQVLPAPKDLEQRFLTELQNEVLDGVLVFTEHKQLLYANAVAHKILGRLHQDYTSGNTIPEEISHVCQFLIQSRHHFPRQNWSIEFDVMTQNATILHIRSKWLEIDGFDHPCLLLIIEDRRRAIVNIVMAESKQYSLTPREKEVWMLHRNGLTYKKIAVELGITFHTVKKHMKSIHSKQKMFMPTTPDLLSQVPRAI